MANVPKKFNLTMHHFRGVVIVFIVLLHIFYPRSLSRELSTNWYLWKEILFHSSSALFAFISGYLAYTIERRNTSEYSLIAHTGAYWLKKVKNVYCPMVFVSSLILLLYFVFGVNFPASLSPTVAFDKGVFLGYFAFGGVQYAYWYIPFIMVMFLFVPLILRVNKTQIAILTFFALIVPLLIARGGVQLYGGHGFSNLLKMLAYHGSHFFIGIGYAVFEEDIAYRIKKYLYGLIILVFVSTIGLYFIYAASPRMKIGSFEWDCAHALYHLQKVALCFVLIHILSLLKSKNFILDCLARYSFCIYFLHDYVAKSFVFPHIWTAGRSFNLISGNFSKIVWSIIGVIITIMLCIVIGWIFNKLLGKKSRLFVGY